MTDFSDFMDSDKFPNRPTHPDFWRLSEIGLQLDGVIQEDAGSVESETAKECDPDSAAYMAEQHSLQCLAMLQSMYAGTLPAVLIQHLHGFFMAEWLQAFIIGSRFQQRGGKQ